MQLLDRSPCAIVLAAELPAVRGFGFCTRGAAVGYHGFAGKVANHDLNIAAPLVAVSACRPAPGSSGGDTARSLFGIGKPVRCVLTYFI